MSSSASRTVWSGDSVCGSVVMTDSTGASTSTLDATSGPTRLPKMSRSVRTPTRTPSGVVTKTESPVPVRWIARRHAPIDVPGVTVTGSRRPISRNGAAASEGTRAATARSVRSATPRVYADPIGDAVAAAGAGYPRAGGSRPSDRRRPGHRVRLRLRVRRAVRTPRVRDRRRLADAHGVEVRDRGVARLGGRPRPPDGPRRAALRVASGPAGGDWPGAVLRLEHGDVLRGDRGGPAVARRAHRLHLPAGGGGARAAARATARRPAGMDRARHRGRGRRAGRRGDLG